MTQSRDPFYGFIFDVQIIGVIVGHFSEVLGLDVNTEFDEYREGGVNEFVHKFPRITNYNNLTLRKGMTESNFLYKWYMDVINGKIERRQLSVILLNPARSPLKIWSFQNAFPVKWVGPELKSDSNSLAIESMEIVHQGIIGQVI